MANSHSLFLDFHNEISLTSSKKTRMKNSKDQLRMRIRKYFKEHHPEYDPKFYIQGSYKMKTTIRTKDDICDLDDGVYFFREPDVTSTTLQSWVKNAVDGHTNETPQHRKKCIRNLFTADYEIDIPVYYKKDDESYQLAIKNEGWENSDPKEMVEWFELQKDKDGVLLRIVKYLKAWCDFKRNQMPSGLAMTILASRAKNKINWNVERDDITLRDILREIKKDLDIKFECVVPAKPNDDLFSEYDSSRRKYFVTALKEFLEDAENAIEEKNKLKSSNLWRKHLGDRFPQGKNENDEDISEKYSSLLGIASQSKPWA